MARMYTKVTITVPRKRLNGMVRWGFTTSAAVNVMLFQASLENRDPTIAAPMAASRPIPMSGVRAPSADVRRASQKESRFAATVDWLRPSTIATTISPINAAVLAMVKTFCITLPPWIPRRFTAVSRTMLAMAISCAALILRPAAVNRVTCSPREGKRTEVNLAKATATAAIVPVWITMNRVQPYRNPISGL